MKWISIEKAKPRFKQDYLIVDENTGAAVVAHLLETKQTESGLRHTFTDGNDAEFRATHIAAITLPEKEVTNG